MSSLESNTLKNSYSPELASVYLLEKAYTNYDQSLIDQVVDEESTRFAEIIDGPIWTEFLFDQSEGGLISKGGSRLLDLWKKSYDLTLQKANTDKRQLALVDFRKLEYEEGIDVEKLAKNGNQGDGFLVISAYPEDIEIRFGKDFVNKEGFNSRRKLAFIRQYEKQGDAVKLTTASIDNSEIDLWNKLLEKNYASANDILGARIPLENNSINTIINSYDHLLNIKYQTPHKQGRSGTKEVETYLFVNNQQDLMDFNLKSLTDIALSEISENEKLEQKNMLTKKVASALIYRYENGIISHSSINSELNSAIERASSEGRELISCGGYLATSEESMLKTVTRGIDDMKCVTCPFCKKTVDAIVKRNSISCPKCKVEVNTKNNKVNNNNKQRISFTKIIEQILQDFFNTAKN